MVKGQATVTIADTKKRLWKVSPVFVPRTSKHRLENRGSDDLIIIEVQIGNYLGEDDITRYEDVYKRQ